ncbi:MAG: hypothetical protein JOS17DRAFT_307468 [Linnemannia elongata]|nr:MAG: hypothetical protein JOS17DRAFT_307468 [Linnemannia elongata]
MTLGGARESATERNEGSVMCEQPLFYYYFIASQSVVPLGVCLIGICPSLSIYLTCSVHTLTLYTSNVVPMGASFFYFLTYLLWCTWIWVSIPLQSSSCLFYSSFCCYCFCHSIYPLYSSPLQSPLYSFVI